MRIEVNGEPRETAARSLADAVAELGLAGALVATALNGDFVPRAERAATPLKHGDRIEIVAPMQGG
jgi:sulfur carrier protein